MPRGWIDRVMKAGRVLFLLDGLDETEPGLRDQRLIPWLSELIRGFPESHYVVSSRAVGYPPGLLRSLEFAECDLLDFDSLEMAEYTRHWCTAVRLAQNEPEQEARVEGATDGDKIMAGFQVHPYIRDLARNPLMLSAVCLVRYFEGGELPQDRAVLYKLCVEGLLHHWDQRRGIHSEFSMEEKLRACREVALAMQLGDRAEYEVEKVRETFGAALGAEGRGRSLFEHIRDRAGLLLERRAGVFGFAHLTFQEYLAARAIHEGNRLGIDPDTLAREHHDGRWKEVIALYCGLVPAPAARAMIERLIAQDDSPEIAAVLAEAYFTSRPEMHQDLHLRTLIIERLARTPVFHHVLSRFPDEEVAPIANSAVGTIRTNLERSEALSWLGRYPKHLDRTGLRERIFHLTTESPVQLSELIYLAFRSLDVKDLARLADDAALLSSRGPCFETGRHYSSQASVALLGLFDRSRLQQEPAMHRILSRVLDQFLSGCPMDGEIFGVGRDLMRKFVKRDLPADHHRLQELGAGVARLIEKAEERLKVRGHPTIATRDFDLEPLRAWVQELDPALTAPPVGGEARRPQPRPRRRGSRR